MHDSYETPFDRDETPFDGDRETRRIDAARDRLDARLADMGARLDRLEASLDRLNGRLDRTIRTMRRLFILLVLGLTVKLCLSVWILVPCASADTPNHWGDDVRDRHWRAHGQAERERQGALERQSWEERLPDGEREVIRDRRQREAEIGREARRRLGLPEGEP